jgi:hypothetical protein
MATPVLKFMDDYFRKIQLNEENQQYEHTNIIETCTIRVHEADIPSIMVCGLNSVDYWKRIYTPHLNSVSK